MPKLLLEYQGKPGIINHRFQRIDKITYIVVYTTGQHDYVREHFQSIEAALDFKPEKVTRQLTFVCVEGNEGEVNNVQYNQISSWGNTLSIESGAVVSKYQQRFAVWFSENSFSITQTYTGLPNSRTEYSSIYSRIKEFDNRYNSLYELIPIFNDTFLEVLFVLDTMATKTPNTQLELEAFLLQAKQRFERGKSI